MMALCLILLPLNIFSAEFTYTRLDPHGKIDDSLTPSLVKEKSECRSCHTIHENVLKTKSDINKRCIKCHNEKPHSGLTEHLGKDLRTLKIGLKGKINCLSCHRSHRNLPPDSKLSPKLLVASAESFLYRRRHSVELRNDQEEKRSGVPMLSRRCTDCHTEKNLP